MDDFKATSLGGVPTPPMFRFVGSVFTEDPDGMFEEVLGIGAGVGAIGLAMGVNGDLGLIGAVGSETGPAEGLNGATGTGALNGVSGLIEGGTGVGAIGRDAGLGVGDAFGIDRESILNGVGDVADCKGLIG